MTSETTRIEAVKEAIKFELRRPVYHGSTFVEHMRELLRYVEQLEQNSESMGKTNMALAKKLLEREQAYDPR